MPWKDYADRTAKAVGSKAGYAIGMSLCGPPCASAGAEFGKKAGHAIVEKGAPVVNALGRRLSRKLRKRIKRLTRGKKSKKKRRGHKKKKRKKRAF